MLKEFKEFAFKGNVIDLAVGVIIGGAFGKIVTSLVNDIFMPIIGMILGGVSFTDLKYIITPANEAEGIAEAAIYYGQFIQNVVDFLIIAFCIFLFIKAVNATKKKEEAKPAEPEKPAEDILLLQEIRDLLKRK